MEDYGSKGCQNERSSVFVAYWPSNGNVHLINRVVTLPLSIGEIQFFVGHTVKFDDSSNNVHHVFAYVHWFCKHSSHD